MVQKSENALFCCSMRRIRKGRVAVALIIVISIIGILGSVGWYYNSLRKVNNNDEIVAITVEDGSTYYSLSKLLYDNKLIKSELGYKIYLKLNAPTSELVAGTYHLSQNMGVKKIIDNLGNKDNAQNLSDKKITIVEGKNIKFIVKKIVDNTDYKEDEIYNVINDSNFLDEMINKYWFLTDDIKNQELFYALEGYLYPDTYYIKEDDSIQDILTVILDHTESKLEPYKEQIQSSTYTIHELLTLASIVELEAATLEDRKVVAGIFYNRLNSNMTLGSDVTTYYAVQKEFVGDDGHINLLTTDDLNVCNGYNTRSNCVKGLPVGPISSVSIESLEAVLNPTASNYYYFVADCNKKIYFAVTDAENLAKKNQLISEDNWCE